MDDLNQEINTLRQVVFVTPPEPKTIAEMLAPVLDEIATHRSGSRPTPAAWIEAMRNAGYAVWATPTTVYVFVGG